MATYKVTSPTGERFKITAPDNATEEQLTAYAKAQFARIQASGEFTPQQIQATHFAKPYKAPPTEDEIRQQTYENLGKAQSFMRTVSPIPAPVIDQNLDLLRMKFANQEQLTPAQQVAQSDPITSNIMAGIGAGMYSPYLGAKQLIGQTEPGEVEEYKKGLGGLRGTVGGTTGEMGGKVAAFLPASFIPGAQGFAGASLLGGGMGLLEPVGEDESRALNTVLGTMGGAFGQQAMSRGQQMMRTAAQKKLSRIASEKSRNELKDKLIKELGEEGYKFPPSYGRAGLGSRLLEGISGKAKTEQRALIVAQKRTNQLAKRALGLDKDAPITLDSLTALKREAFESGYEPVRNAGPIKTDAMYKKALSKILSKYHGASRSFPGVKADVADDLAPVGVDSFDAGDAIDMSSILRDNADKAFAAGDNAKGRALKETAKALEDQIERHLSKAPTAQHRTAEQIMADLTHTKRAWPTTGTLDEKMAVHEAKKAAASEGPKLLRSFRLAREKIARANTVKRALVEGTGDVDATVIARELSGKPFGGELKTIAKFGDTFRKIARVPRAGDVNPFDVVDYTVGMGGAVFDPTMLALPAGRVGARELILSRPWQSHFLQQQYGTAPLLRGGAALMGAGQRPVALGLPAGLLRSQQAEQ